MNNPEEMREVYQSDSGRGAETCELYEGNPRFREASDPAASMAATVLLGEGSVLESFFGGTGPMRVSVMGSRGLLVGRSAVGVRPSVGNRPPVGESGHGLGDVGV